VEALFVKLYPLVAFLSLSGYVPQLIKLVRAKIPTDGIALQSWLTWILNNSISLGYGVFHLRDKLFITTVCTSLTSMCAVVGMVVYNRHFRFKRRGVCLTTYRSGGLI
jgi:hypothetical protein